MNLRLPFLVIPTMVLTACGGSGSSGVSFAELQDRAESIENLPVTADADLPTSGTGTYSGVAIAVAGDSDAELGELFLAIGAVEAVADFSDQTVSGTASSFYETDDTVFSEADEPTFTAISGSVDFSLTQAVEGRNLYEGETDGRLRSTDDVVYNFDLPAAGGFSGANAQQFSMEAFEESGNTSSALIVVAD